MKKKYLFIILSSLSLGAGDSTAAEEESAPPLKPKPIFYKNTEGSPPREYTSVPGSPKTRFRGRGSGKSPIGYKNLKGPSEEVLKQLEEFSLDQLFHLRK